MVARNIICMIALSLFSSNYGKKEVFIIAGVVIIARDFNGHGSATGYVLLYPTCYHILHFNSLLINKIPLHYH